jgi:hypothetical protein
MSNEPEGAYECHSRRLDMFFRSLYELYFAEAVHEYGLQFLYEPFWFLVGRAKMIPDFYFPDYNCFVEVKGKWGAGQKSKMKRFREHYAHVALLVLPWTAREEFYPERG